MVGAADVSVDALDWFRKNINENGFVTKDHRELLDGRDVDAVAGYAATGSIRNGWKLVDLSPVPEEIRDEVF